VRAGKEVRRARERGEEESDGEEVERIGHFPLISGIGR
jgi:hypothetical protein